MRNYWRNKTKPCQRSTPVSFRLLVLVDAHQPPGRSVWTRPFILGRFTDQLTRFPLPGPEWTHGHLNFTSVSWVGLRSPPDVHDSGWGFSLSLMKTDGSGNAWGGRQVDAEMETPHVSAVVCSVEASQCRPPPPVECFWQVCCLRCEYVCYSLVSWLWSCRVCKKVIHCDTEDLVYTRVESPHDFVDFPSMFSCKGPVWHVSKICAFLLTSFAPDGRK